MLTVPERPFRPGLHRFKVLAQHIPPAAPKSAWLDLGGGAGEFSLIAAQRGYAVTLVDGDPRNVANAKGRGLRAVLADLSAPLKDFADATFDGISLIEVVEHITTAERLMSEAYRVLKPDGVLLLSTPNAVWWQERLRVLLGRPLGAEGYHYRFFTNAGARALFKDAGFTVDSMEFSAPAVGINLFRRLILRRTGRKHIAVAAPFAGLLAQTIYVVGRKP